MPIDARVVRPLQSLLVLAFAALLVAQVRALPAAYDDWVRTAPLDAGPAWMLPVAVLVLLCAQAVVVCTWKLLRMVERDRIFSGASFVWVDTVLAAVGVAWGLLLATFLAAAVPGRPPGPTTTVLLLLLLVATGLAGLLMVVMRALLRQATALRAELDEVV